MRQRAHAMPGPGIRQVDWPLPRLTVDALDRAAVPDVLPMYGASHGGNRAGS
jgi:hypothetical protein